jgi:DNA-binding response OmpR family regulator
MRSIGGADTKIVLVVEEEVSDREQLVEFVRRLGFIAIPVADAESAGVIARKLHVDLVILRVPEDLAAVAAISDFKRRRSETGVLVLTRTDTLTEPLLRSAGVDAVLPYTSAVMELEEPIRRILRTGVRSR